MALGLLQQRLLIVDVDAGVITRPNGDRAEYLRQDYGGMVLVGRTNGKIRWAQAHRIVWMARFGPIPANLVVNHRNRRRWDNRIDNLDLTDRSGNRRHAFGSGYAHVASSESTDPNAASLARLMADPGVTSRPDQPNPLPSNWLGSAFKHRGDV